MNALICLLHGGACGAILALATAMHAPFDPLAPFAILAYGASAYHALQAVRHAILVAV